jgi:hypothetical protein
MLQITKINLTQQIPDNQNQFPRFFSQKIHFKTHSVVHAVSLHAHVVNRLRIRSVRLSAVIELHCGLFSLERCGCGSLDFGEATLEERLCLGGSNPESFIVLLNALNARSKQKIVLIQKKATKIPLLSFLAIFSHTSREQE